MTHLPDRIPLLSYASLALSMALVGTYVALSKPLAILFPIFLLAALRFSIGGVAMAGWLKKPKDEIDLTRKTQALIFLESFLGNFLFTICMLYGMRLTTAVAAGIILSALPAVVAILSWLFLKEKISWQSWFGIACSAVGIALYSLFKTAHGESSPVNVHPPGDWSTLWLGNLLLIMAVVCEASYAVIGKKLTEGLKPKRIAALINLWGLVLTLPLGIWAGLSFDFGSVPLPTWGFLLLYGLAASVWTVWLWMTGLKHVPASQAGVFTVMLPISAAAAGVLFLGERLTSGQLMAFGIALLGVIVATRTNPKPQRQ